MATTHSPDQAQSTSRTISSSLGLSVAVLGVAVLMGWVTEVDFLKSLLPGLAPMRPNAAIGFVLTGSALVLLNLGRGSSLSPWLVRGAAAATMVLGALTFAEVVLGWNLGIDDALFGPPGDDFGMIDTERLSGVESVCFIAVGAALILVERARFIAAQLLGLLVMAASAIVIGGYLFGVTTFPTPGLPPPTAAHAALGFLLLSLGILVSSARHGVFRPIQDQLPEIGLGSVLLLLLLAGIAAQFDTQRMAATALDVEQTYTFRERLQSLSLGTERAVTTARLFILTGEESFVLPLADIRSQIDDDIGALRAMVSGYPDQQARLVLLEGLVGRRLELSDEYIRLRRGTGVAEAVEEIPVGGEQLALEIRSLVGEMMQAERVRLEQQQSRADASHRSALTAMGFAWAAGFIVLWLAFNEIRKRTRERAAMEREIVAIREHERTRIGQDLHDGLGQELTGISLGLEMLANALGRDRSEHEGMVRNLKGLIQRTIAQTRRIARALSPGFWGDMGPGEAIAALATEVRQNAGVSCAVEGENPVDRPDPELTVNLYRIAQEAISNALRHGEAENIIVRWGQEDDMALLEVLDDGSGIPGQAERSNGMGLRSMRHRARMIGGHLAVAPRPEGGTRVCCYFPWPRRNARRIEDRVRAA